MKKIILAALLLTLGTVAFAQYTAFSYESVTYAASASGFTASTLTRGDGRQAAYCSGRLETAQIRYRYDGIAPTSSVGLLLEIGDTITVSGFTNLSLFKGIRPGSTSGLIKWACHVQGE